MNQVTDAYAKVLLDLNIPSEDIETADNTLKCCRELFDAMSSPAVLLSAKDRIIEKVFSSSLHNFFKVLCRNEQVSQAHEIFRSYRSLNRKAQGCIKAVLEYVTPLTEEQKVRITELVKRKTGYEKVELELIYNPRIMGGFILRAGDYRYDRSTASAVAYMKKGLIRPGAESYSKRNKKSSHVIKATLEYVTPPTEEQKTRIIELIRKKTGYKEVELNLKENKELIGGFVLRAGNLRYDRSAVREIANMRRKLMRR